MSDDELSVEEKFKRLEDIDEKWALELMQECERDMHAAHIDDKEIYVEEPDFGTSPPNFNQSELIPVLTDQIFLPANESNGLFDKVEPTTAIERQIMQRAQQVKSEPSNTNKAFQGFWSIFKSNKALN
jgi:hypothetical protein